MISEILNYPHSLNRQQPMTRATVKGNLKRAKKTNPEHSFRKPNGSEPSIKDHRLFSNDVKLTVDILWIDITAVGFNRDCEIIL